MSASPTAALPALPPHITRRLKPHSAPAADGETTDYELSPSTLQPPVESPSIAIGGLGKLPPAAGLDGDARQLFQHRLMLCFLVAAFPFLFFFVSSIVGFIDLFKKDVVGWPGIILSGFTLACLLIAAGLLYRLRTLPERWLRVTEIAAFGIMALCFAYWQFSLLTATTLQSALGTVGVVASTTAGPVLDQEKARQEQFAVLAAALIAHFNWFALLVFHGVLVPNTLARGVGVACSMVATALVIDTFAAIFDVTTSGYPWMLFAVATAILSAGAGLSIFGTAKTAALRAEVETARAAVRALGQYRLRRKLGQGGMGEVYLAEHQLLNAPAR